MPVRRAAAVLAALVLALTAPTTAQATTAVDHYISYVVYYSDASLTTIVGARTFNSCPGESGTWGWGGSTGYYTITSEPC